MDSTALIHIIFPVALAGLMNAWIFKTGLNQMNSRSSNKQSSSLLPPGAVIGTVWTGIFALLGYLHYIIWKRHGNRIAPANYVLWGLFLYCLVYPVVTGLKESTGLIMNLGALVLGFLVAGFIAWSERWSDLIWLVPYLCWTLYVNIVFVIICSNLI